LIEQVGTIDPKIIVKAPQERPTFKSIAPTPKPVTPGATGIGAVQYMIFEKDKGKYMPNAVTDSQRLIMKRPFKPYDATELRTHNRRYDEAEAILTAFFKSLPADEIDKDYNSLSLVDALATQFALSRTPRATAATLKRVLNLKHDKGGQKFKPKDLLDWIDTDEKIPLLPKPKPPPSSSSGPPSSSSGAPSGPYDPSKNYMILSKAPFATGKYSSTKYKGDKLNADPEKRRAPKIFSSTGRTNYNDRWARVVRAMGADNDDNEGPDKVTNDERQKRDEVASKFAVFVDSKEMAGEDPQKYIDMFEEARKVADDFGVPKFKPEFIVDKIVTGKEAELKGSGISESMANKLVGKPNPKPKGPAHVKPKLTGSGDIKAEEVYPVSHPTAEDVQRNNIKRYLMEIKSSKPSDVPDHRRVEGWRNPVVSREYTAQDDSILLGERIRSSTHEINKMKSEGKSIIPSPVYYVPFVVSV
jgi:hypothetical protein